MDAGVSLKERIHRVEKVILDLGLSKSADTIIGSSSRKGISGGERKRLAFACEVHFPFFIDGHVIVN